jgi:energy-coupling factor transport system permease protein
MKMPNIELSFKRMFFQPVRTMEYILVSLLLRRVKLSDELSAAALTRGIDGENSRTSLREVRIFFSDAVITGVFVVLAAALWYLDKNIFAFMPAGRLWL